MGKDKGILVTCFDGKFEEEDDLLPTGDGLKEIPKEEKEPPELVMVSEALDAAKKAFDDLLFEKYTVDPAYYRFSMRVEFRDSSFAETLAELNYKDMH